MPLIKLLIPFFTKSLNKKMDGVIGVAPMIMEYFKYFKGKKEIIPNGINLNVFNPNNEKYKEYIDNKLNLLFVGRFEQRKGLLYLIKAYNIIKKKNDNVKLLVVGEGPQKQECEAFIKQNNLKDIVFLGKVTGEEVAKYFNTADIYISPAPFGESFGIVLLEAMASGKPVVGFANLGYYQLLKESKGEEFLARPKNVEELAQKILKLVEDEKLRTEIGDWGLEYSKNYSWEKIADRVLNFYKNWHSFLFDIISTRFIMAKKLYLEAERSLFLLVVKKEKNMIVITKILSRSEDDQIEKQLKGNNFSLNQLGGKLSLAIKKDIKTIIEILNITNVYGKIRPYQIND